MPFALKYVRFFPIEMNKCKEAIVWMPFKHGKHYFRFKFPLEIACKHIFTNTFDLY